MKLELDLRLYLDLEDEISKEEFALNWASQTPHWDYLTDEGISFFKGTKKRKWKK